MLRSNLNITKLVLDTSIGSAMLVISILGIIGNLFTLCFLPRNRSQLGKLVYTLAIFDLIFLHWHGLCLEVLVFLFIFLIRSFPLLQCATFWLHIEILRILVRCLLTILVTGKLIG